MIKIKIKATNTDLTDEIKKYIEKKVKKFEKFISKKAEALCEVEIGKTTRGQQKGDIFKAEFNLDLDGKLHRSEITHSDVKAAVDIARKDMLNILRKSKKKRNTLLKKGGAFVKSIIKFNKKD